MKTGFSLCGKSTQGKPCYGPVLALYGIAVWVPLIKMHCRVHYSLEHRGLILVLYGLNYRPESPPLEMSNLQFKRGPKPISENDQLTIQKGAQLWK